MAGLSPKPPRPTRVLLVANFDRRRHQATFYNVDNLLHSGLLRAGHHVIPFSDRDTALENSPLRLSSRFGGLGAMQRRLLRTAEHYSPDLVLFGHADLVDEATIRNLRRSIPGARLAQFNVDAVFNSRSMSAFCDRARLVDISFITTGNLDSLALLSPGCGPVHYFPNPVDASVETARTFEKRREELAFDGQFLGGRLQSRDELIDRLAAGLPAGYRFRSSARDLGGRRLRSLEFLAALAEAGCMPNLPHDDKIPVPYLYSSDRIAQCLGQGVAVLAPGEAGLREIYDEGILEFRSFDHLIDSMAFLQRNDDARRRQARMGWRIAHERTAGHRVAKYMVETALDMPLSEEYGWPAAPVAGGLPQC